MSCKIAIVGTLLLVYCTNNVYAAPTDACTGGPDAAGDCGGPNELCNAATSGVCECDAANGFEESGDPAACTLKDCSTNNPTPTGYTITGTTLVGDTPTVACDTGYTGPPTATTLNCETDGNYNTAFAGCSPVDCASDSTPTGYTNLASTKYGESATADCDGSNGYAGIASAAAGACTSVGTWDVSKFSGCALADCTGTSVDTGYLVTGTKTFGGSPNVACDTGNGYTGSAAAITCDVNSQWSAFSGCTSSGGGGGSVDLGNSCANDGECTSGNGGSGSKCGTTSNNCECDASRNYVASASTCKLATDLGNACSANEECTLGNGGAGGTCSSTSNNCECDEASGYTQTGTSCTQNAGSTLLSMFNVVSMLAFILVVKLM